MTAAALTVTATSASRPYNTANSAFGVTYSGFVNGDSAAGLGGTLSETTTATTASAVGGYPSPPPGLTSHDYAISYIAGTLTVTQANPVLTWANPAAITYGSALSATQLNASANAAGTFVYTPAAGAVLGAGNQTLKVTFTPTDTTDYTSATATVTLVVNQATPTVTWPNPAGITYGTALSATQLDATASVPGAFVYAPAAGAVLGAGSQTLNATFTPTDTVDYVSVPASATLAVAAKALTVTSTNATMVYGAALPTLGFTAGGLVGADAIASVTQTTAAGPAAAVGSYALTPSAAVFSSGSGVNYAITYVAGTVTGTRAVLTVTATNLSMAYGAAVPALTDTITGYVNGDTSAVVSGSAALSTTATSASAVGSYPITAAQGSLSAANYTFAVVNGTMTVGKAVLTVNATVASKVYGAALPALPYAFTGFLNGDTSAVVSGTPTLISSATAASPVGSYTDTVTSVGGLSAANYSFAIGATAAFTVTPAVLTVTANNLSMAYGAAVPTLTDAITGFVNSDPPTVVSGAAAMSTTATSASVVCSYPNTSALGTLAEANYTFAFVNGTMTVGKAVLTVNATVASKVYGAAMPALPYAIAGFQNGDTSAVVSGVPTLTSTATASSAVGSYIDTVTSVSGLAAANYSFAIGATAAFTVTPAVLTVTANNLSMAYGAAVPTLTDAITGFVNSDPPTVVSGAAALATTATSASAVGSYPITAAHGTLAASNYTFAFVNGTMTVGKAVLTVNATVASKVYGAAMPALPYAIAGFQNGDTSAVVSGAPTLTSSATAASAVGAYTDTVTSVSGLAATNYSFAIGATAAFTVTPAVLTVTANNLSMAYGAAVPTLTDAITGFVNSDPPTVVSGAAAMSTTATSASAAGSYPITAALGTLAAANYTFAFVNGTMTVGKAVLTVNATVATKIYGAAMPALPYAIAGFQNGDGAGVVTGAPTLSSTATASSAVGSYTDTVTSVSGLAAANYSFAIGATAAFTVTPAVLTVTANNLSMAYGAAVPTLTDATTGFVNSDPPTVVSGAAALATTATSSSAVGSYPITAALGTLAGSNYTFAFVNGTMTVGKAVLTVNATVASKVYGAAMPALPYVIAGFQNGDTSAVVTGTPTLSSTANAGSNVGSYTDTVTSVSGLAAANYSFAIGATAAFTVTPATLTVTANNLSTGLRR